MTVEDVRLAGSAYFLASPLVESAVALSTPSLDAAAWRVRGAHGGATLAIGGLGSIPADDRLGFAQLRWDSVLNSLEESGG